MGTLAAAREQTTAGKDQKPETSLAAATGTRRETAWPRVAAVEAVTGG